MLISLILTACSDHIIKYPVPVEDTAYTNDTPVAGETDGTYDTSEDEVLEEDTGYEEPIDEEEDVIEDTDYEDDVEEPVEDTAEEVVEEPEDEPVEEDEPEEIEEEEIIEEEVVEEEEEEEPVITTVDNFNYADDFVMYWEDFYYADDYGWSFIDGTATNFICGIQYNGFIACRDVDGNNNTPTNSINSYTPFEQVIDLSVTNGSSLSWQTSQDVNLCAINTTGDIFCYDNQGGTYSPPKVNEYVDVVVGQGINNDPYVCGLDSSGYVYCFDQATNGLIHSDSNLYKVIEGKEGPTCGLHDDGVTLTCWNLDQARAGLWNNHQIPTGDIWTITAPAEVIGLAVAGDSYCYAYVDPATGLQTTECAQWYTYTHPNNHREQCITSSPHQLYYDFFVDSEDLTNIEIGLNINTGYDFQQQAGIVTQNGTEVAWGGNDCTNNYYCSTNIVNNGYYTGSGCNYYWGN